MGLSLGLSGVDIGTSRKRKYKSKTLIETPIRGKHLVTKN